MMNIDPLRILHGESEKIQIARHVAENDWEWVKEDPKLIDLCVLLYRRSEAERNQISS